MTTLHLKRSTSRSPSRLALLLIPLVFAFALSPQAWADCREGCDTNFNTFLGDDALSSNTHGVYNTAVGTSALTNNTLGSQNTAIGLSALTSNTTGFGNTASGYDALGNNTTGLGNTANGFNALLSNTDGERNTANGNNALTSNTTGNFNVANGDGALRASTTGSTNTADGYYALSNNTTGSHNIAIGSTAGSNLTTGSNNIDIGALGVAGEANTMRLGKNGTQTDTYIAGISRVAVAGGVDVIIDTSGHLGTIVSSARYKDDIQPMAKASEAILALKPVTFRYKKHLDPDGIPQFGLVAEDVEKVNPDLVARDGEGKPYTVRYDAVNAMLLNEFLKEHRKVEEQQGTIGQLKSNAAMQEATISELKKDMGVLTAQLKEQAAQIQKVSAQLEASKPAPHVVNNP